MIDRQEISDFSREFGLAANAIEKDYVLGWLLAGIFSHPELDSSWIFKGGTCLKKCYFETYRFSEDLDFTVLQVAHQDQDFLVEAFKKVADWVYDASGIEIPHELIRFDVYTNPRGKISVQGRIGYRGPLRPRGDLPRVKLDLTNDEVLVLDPVNREVHHPYSDRPDDGISALCYSFEEVFAEKIRALASKTGITWARRRSTTTRKPKSRTSNYGSYGPKYVFRCMVCGKQFTRKSHDSSLNQHKNRQGYPCPGRTGIYVTTKY